MDLRTGTPLWLGVGGPGPATTSPLTRDERCDVLVIGAGISGATAALLLAEAGLNVVVADHRPIARGSTAACTALVQYDVDTPLVELEEQVGTEAARAAYRATYRANGTWAELIERHGIACGLARRPGLYLATTDADVALLRREAEARRALGIDADFLDRAELLQAYGINRPGAVRSATQFQLDPVKLTHGLLARAAERGARVYEPVEVVVDRSIGMANRVNTTEGRSIACEHVVFAIGYETPELFAGLREHCELRSTYALASTPMENDAPLWPEEALVWEYADPYLYARTTEDGRVMVGGEDELFHDAEARDALIPAKMRAILVKLRRLFPSLAPEPEFVWAGTFAATDDGLPLIGTPEASRRCHFALGYGGNGVTYSLLAAEVLRDGILGRPNTLAGVFGFERTGLR